MVVGQVNVNVNQISVDAIYRMRAVVVQSIFVLSLLNLIYNQSFQSNVIML